MKTPFDIVNVRAGQEASSLISEGYVLRTCCYYNGMPRVWFKMVHRSNGNTISALITPERTLLWKNRKLIKNEPTDMRGV